MEENLVSILDHLTIAETENLLDREMKMDISTKQITRIKNSVNQKVNPKHKKQIYIPRKLAACLAALLLVLTSMSLVGFNNVAAALGKVFSFIPGVGIVENNESFQYVLSEPVSAENSDFKLTLNNAFATKDNITVMLTLSRKNFDEAHAKKDDQAANPTVILYAGDEKITNHSSFIGGGGHADSLVLTYTVDADFINTSEIYKLEYAAYGLSLNFKLKNYDAYDTLEQIGPTATHNGISITAVPTFLDGELQVDLYAINKSGYRLTSYSKVYKEYLNNDLHLETNSGTKSYTLPDGYSNLNGRFMFDILPSDQDFKLKIPYLTVSSDESKNIALDIPEEGKRVTVNQKIDFKDCTMTIVDIEKTPGSLIGDAGELIMTVKYENKKSNRVMQYPMFNRPNISSVAQNEAMSVDMDENGVYTTIHYALNKGESGKLRLNVNTPLYVLTDEYELAFSRGE